MARFGTRLKETQSLSAQGRVAWYRVIAAKRKNAWMAATARLRVDTPFLLQARLCGFFVRAHSRCAGRPPHPAAVLFENVYNPIQYTPVPCIATIAPARHQSFRHLVE